jgi:hypothetical protein
MSQYCGRGGRLNDGSIHATPNRFDIVPSFVPNNRCPDILQ